MTARRVATALLALVAFACVAEWSVGRWLVAPRNDVLATPFGRLFRPGSRYLQSAEGWGEFRANAEGFLDRDLAPRSGPLAVLLGDSFGQGLQVRAELRFSEIAEQRLPGLQVLNAAGAGQAPIHYALFAERYVRAFHPDVLLLQLNDADLTDVEDTRADAEALAEFVATRNAVRLSEPGAVAAATPARDPLRRLVRSSALLTFLDSRVARLTRQERTRLSAKLRGEKPDTRDVVALPPSPHARALLDSLVGEVVRIHPRVVLVYVPHIHYYRTPLDVAYPLRRAWFHALAERRGLPLVDPSDAMLAEYRRTGEPLHGFTNTQPATGHLNERGHRVLGERLAAVLAGLTSTSGSRP